MQRHGVGKIYLVNQGSRAISGTEQDGLKTTLIHSHSIVLSYGNALDFRHNLFLRTKKNRLTDPSEIRALDFIRKFRRSVISSVSATTGINRSISF